MEKRLNKDKYYGERKNSEKVYGEDFTTLNEFKNYCRENGYSQIYCVYGRPKKQA